MNLEMKEKYGMSNKSFQRIFIIEYFRFGKSILSKLVDTVSQYVTDKETTSILDIGTGY
jgi:hypothetical protein